MDNQAWTQVEAAFARQRQENEREEARRRAQIAQKHPELDRLLRERHQMILSSVKSAFSGAVPSDPEAAMADYNARIAALLAACGYPKDYLAPVCRCALCGDAGYIYDQSVRKPCTCFQQAYLNALAQAGRDSAPGETFANFDETRFPDESLPGTDVTQRQYMRVVRDKCRQYADGVPDGPIKTLLLHGGSGLGKTFLLNCVGFAAREKGVDALYTTAYDLLMELKNAYYSRGEGAQEYFDAPLLLIDDLGMEPLIENVTVEQFYHLINSRLVRGLYTAVSTNLGREEIRARYTERVSSRLLDTKSGMAIPFRGKDIRLMK